MDKLEAHLGSVQQPVAVVVQWTVRFYGKAKKAMKPGGLQPLHREAAERGLAEISTNPQSGRPMEGGDHRWIWDDKVNAPDFRMVYEFDASTAIIAVRYIGDRGSVPY